MLNFAVANQGILKILRTFRAATCVPIIIATSRIEEIHTLLEADDYICEPLSSIEVVTRVKTVLQRLQTKTSVMHINDLKLDAINCCVHAHSRKLELTKIEFQLFKTLYTNPTNIISRWELMNSIYPDNRIVSDRTIDSHIKKLRNKLKELLPDQEVIDSVYGFGYRYLNHPKSTKHSTN